MTYCLGIRLNDGIVFAADSRTNAGVDIISMYRKLFTFEKPGDRNICVMTAGNLAVTQAVVSQLEEGLDDEDDDDTLYTVSSMSDATKMVGRALRNVRARDEVFLKADDADSSASFIVGGQIAGRRMRLFLVYSAGNYIEATDDTPYLQIGESKYGKPILERVVTPQMDLAQAAKCALVSLDSTIRSNVAVAPPIDMVVIIAALLLNSVFKPMTNTIRISRRTGARGFAIYLIAYQRQAGWKMIWGNQNGCP